LTTAAEIISEALRIFGILDQAEDPTPDDIANGVKTLNNLLRNEQADGACQYLMKLAQAVALPAGVSGQIYTFTIGNGAGFTLNADAVAVKAIYMQDVGVNVNRETRMAPKADVIRTTFPSLITRWHQERQVDGSILITAGQPPRAATKALIDYGARVPAITAADGSDMVAMPPEGIHDATLLLGATLCGSYGKPINDPILAGRVQAVDEKWKRWARGQQWLRYVRA